MVFKTKFRVLVDLGILTPPPLNFYKALRFVPLIEWTPLTDTTG